MRIQVICIGKLKEKYWTDAVNEYMKRLSKYCDIDVLELKESRLPDKASPAQEAAVVEEEGKTILMVNTDSRIVKKDVEVENGYIHGVDKVLSPSRATVADLILITPNTQMFGYLLQKTGWDKKLQSYKDESYYDWELDGVKIAGITTNTRFNGNWEGRYPEHRYFGYTVFVEPDSVFEKYGLLVEDGIDEKDIEVLYDWLKENALYDNNTSYENDYESEDNALNQFIAYHILPQRLTFDRLVIFSNEKGYNNLSPNVNNKHITNVWEYYETMGKHRRSVKVTGIKSGKRLNRHSVYNLTSYIETSSQITVPGLEISSKNGEYANNGVSYIDVVDGTTYQLIYTKW
jgi:hypothetical protein